MNENHLQQGDVVIKRINALPEGLKKLNPLDRHNKKQIVLAFGEVTGHAHAIDMDKTADIDWCEDTKKGVFYFHIKRLEGKDALKHEEHKNMPTTKLKPGIYTASTLLQEDMFSDLVKPVVD